MSFFNKFEHKFSKYAIHNLMYYFVVLYAIGFVMSIVNIQIYYEYLALDVPKVLHGQIWRLITWMIYPPSNNILFSALMLWMYFSLGNTLENIWGAFRFNVFMLMGVFFHILAAFILYFGFGLRYAITPDNLNMSILVAFALTFPDMEFFIYFVLRIKAKYLALFYIVIGLYNFIRGNQVTRVTLFLSGLNFIIFFVMTKMWRGITPKRVVQKENKTKIKVPSRTVHKCAVCGRTEKDMPDMEFRYCSKCNGNYEYCAEHLYTHKHIE